MTRRFAVLARLLLALSIPALDACGGSSPALTPAAASLANGCSPDRVAVAHRADGALETDAAAPPRVCTTGTGFGSAETHIRVAPDGRVFEEPAVLAPGVAGTGFIPGAPGPQPETQLSIAGLAVSGDRGGHWDFVKPGGATWVAQDAALYIDRISGRVFFYALAANPAPQSGDVPLPDQVPSIAAHLLASGDGGATWTIAAIPGFNNSENPRFTTAPAPTGQPAPTTGPTLAYWCGNNMQFTFAVRICYRSGDAGASWQQASILLSRGLPQHAECGTSGESIDTYDGLYPQGASDGALWLLVNCGGKSFLARSDDEGASFPVLRKAGGSEPLLIPPAEELRIDPQGTLYSVHQDGAALLLRVSRDGGQNWSEPADMTAPAARGSSIPQWALAIGAPGEAAIAYLAARDGGGYDGYVTMTRDALAARPLFWSGRVNAAQAPLITSPHAAKDDYIDVDIGPDGSPWAAFYADCPADGSDAFCGSAPAALNPLATATTIAHLAFR